MWPDTVRRKLSFGARINGRKRFRYPTRSISCIQPPAHLDVSSGDGGTEEGGQFATWIRNKLVFLRNPVNSKGMAEARPVHQLKSTRCSTLIYGRPWQMVRVGRAAAKVRFISWSLQRIRSLQKAFRFFVKRWEMPRGRLESVITPMLL
jgi:hypothetical protein